MLAEVIRGKLAARPFEPFLIRMNDGREFRVPHPDFADVSPRGRVVVVYDRRDALMELSSLLVASVEPLPPEDPRAAHQKGR